ncbi:MAG: starch-binding protein [Ruminococcus sp.]|nr:starch-binding protein [Ruminococcus sp.]
MQKSKRIISIVLALMIVASILAVAAVATSAAENGSQVYFDNSKYNWEKVYVYAYGTKENAKWPGELMELDESGLYTKSFPSTYKSENIIFTNGLEKGEGKEQYPEAAGLALKVGECKMLTADLQWIDYGKPDGHGYGFAYAASGKGFSTDYLTVELGLKNAEKGYYSIDGSPKTEYANGDIIKVGEGKIANTTVNLELYATGSDGVETTQSYTYKKTFTESKTTITASSDGHTTESETGYYGTNPNLQLGKYKTITVDGKVDDWDSSMIIAQGQANDDPRVYMPSSMHEQPWDAYALYAAWDDENLYFMWELANTTYIVSPSDNFAASNEARPWRNSIPMYLALSIDPDKQATGVAIGTNKDGSTYTNPFVWGCTNGVAKDGGTSFTTHIDTLVAMDSNNSNGGDSIFKADVLADDGTYLFNYDTRVTIGVRNFQAQDNQNGFKIKYANGTKSTSLYGINAPKGSRVMGDNLDSNSNFVDFFDLGYKANYGYIYEVAIPLSTLNIDRNYIETKGIGAMQILTYGTSAMDTLPHDPSVLDNANVEYSYDPSTTHEKEDIDNITVPLARVGALLPDTEINYAPLEVNFGADRSSGQAVNTNLTLSADAYHTTGSVNYEFKVNGATIQNSSSSSMNWTPTEVGVYEISVVVTDDKSSVTSTKTFSIGTAQSFVPSEPATKPIETTEPTTVTEPTTTTEPTTDPKPTMTGYELGDVNMSGSVTIDDATLIQKYVAEIDDLTAEQLKLADTDNNGKIEINDVTQIQKFLAGMIGFLG